MVLGKPEEQVGATSHRISASPPSTPGSCWQGEARSDSRGDQDCASIWTIQALRSLLLSSAPSFLEEALSSTQTNYQRHAPW